MQPTAIYKIKIKILCFLLLSIFKLHSPKNNALKISFTIKARLREKLGPPVVPATMEPEVGGSLCKGVDGQPQ